MKKGDSWNGKLYERNENIEICKTRGGEGTTKSGWSSKLYNNRPRGLNMNLTKDESKDANEAAETNGSSRYSSTGNQMSQDFT